MQGLALQKQRRDGAGVHTCDGTFGHLKRARIVLELAEAELERSCDSQTHGIYVSLALV